MTRKTTCPLCQGTGKVDASQVTLGDRMRVLRGRRTQQSVAQDLGISRAQLANIESARSNPSFTVLAAAADLFHVSTDYLIGREAQE